MAEDYYWGEAENAIEWMSGEEAATVTLRPGRLQNRLMRLAEEDGRAEIRKRPEDNDGYLVARVPVKWLKIMPPRTSTMTEERKEQLREQLRAFRVSETKALRHD